MRRALYSGPGLLVVEAHREGQWRKAALALLNATCCTYSWTFCSRWPFISMWLFICTVHLLNADDFFLWKVSCHSKVCLDGISVNPFPFRCGMGGAQGLWSLCPLEETGNSGASECHCVLGEPWRWDAHIRAVWLDHSVLNVINPNREALPTQD